MSWSNENKEPSLIESSPLPVEHENQFNDNYHKYIKRNIFNISFFFDLFGDEDMIIELDPFDILFSQRNINQYFKNGASVYDLISQLVKGDTSPDDVEMIRICVKDDYLWSQDNRRLYCFREAIKQGATFEKIKVILTKDYYNLEDKIHESKYRDEDGNLIQHIDFYEIVNVTPFIRTGVYI